MSEQELIMASGSETRARMLRDAGVAFATDPARVDEAAVRHALIQEGAGPREIADTLAELKARQSSQRNPGRLVLGADQILKCGSQIFSKAADAAGAAETLRFLRNRRHNLFSAAVICLDGQPVWRHVGEAALTMRPFSDAFLGDYVRRNLDAILASVGCYRLEEEGIQLFSRIEGNHHVILGLPLMEVLAFLRVRGLLAT
jgi:septum formation protein